MKDNFETRIYLMFIHFSIILIVFKKKKEKFNQKEYDQFFNYIENDLRELSYGDMTVNKKMKDLNKILYDILLKLDLNSKNNQFKICHKLVSKYFPNLKDSKSLNYMEFYKYFSNFYDFCFEFTCKNMLKNLNKFKY